jgi:hypothetical protein
VASDGYRRKADSIALPQRKYRRKWKSNKVLKQLVLGSDIGLEEDVQNGIMWFGWEGSHMGNYGRKLFQSSWKRPGHHC